ncbi:MAG: hypothetical protein IJU96_02470 [Clostridia bacterium]|nr:hypothetical protein [Clostridia bacterium]
MAKAETEKKKLFSSDTNVKLAAVLAAFSVLLLSLTVWMLAQLGFFHMLWGLAIPRATPYQGVISQENQITEVPKGELRFRLNDEVVFKNAYGKGTLMFENPASSAYVLEFSLYRVNDRSNAIYVSPKLQPGECLINDKLDKPQKKGNYACICIVRAYDSAGNYVGKNIVDISMTIEAN